MHEQAFRALGADVSNAHGYLIAKVKNAALHGADIEFRTPSVGATKNAMLTAVVAKGTTTLRNAAMEPEVVDLANFLVAMGGRIAGQGTDTVVIEGVESLEGVEYEIIADRIVAGTLLICGAATRGDVRVTRCNPAHLEALGQKLTECGVKVTRGADWMRVQADRITGGTDILTAPHPGFPTDLQPQMLTFLCTVPGTSVVEETIFNARFSYVNELARMGADVRVGIDNNTALIKGGTPLSGAPVEAPDIRAGAALVVAGLAAQGETEIIGLEYIDRGYERLEEMLSTLGGQVQRASGIAPFMEPVGTYETSALPKGLTGSSPTRDHESSGPAYRMNRPARRSNRRGSPRQAASLRHATAEGAASSRSGSTWGRPTSSCTSREKGSYCASPRSSPRTCAPVGQLPWAKRPAKCSGARRAIFKRFGLYATA